MYFGQVGKQWKKAAIVPLMDQNFSEVEILDLKLKSQDQFFFGRVKNWIRTFSRPDSAPLIKKFKALDSMETGFVLRIMLQWELDEFNEANGLSKQKADDIIDAHPTIDRRVEDGTKNELVNYNQFVEIALSEGKKIALSDKLTEEFSYGHESVGSGRYDLSHRESARVNSKRNMAPAPGHSEAASAEMTHFVV